MTNRRPEPVHRKKRHLSGKEPRNDIRGSRIRYGRRRRRARRRRWRIVWKRFLPTLALSALFIYGIVNLTRYAVRSVSTWHTNAQLEEMYVQALPSAEPESTPEPAPTAEPTDAPKEHALLDAYQYISDEILPGAREMLAKNADAVAWLRIPGIVSLPVVYRDNSYYLDRDFYGNKNESGTLFLDEAHPLRQDTQYMVIHGHNMHDGSMFGLLSHYRKGGYMEEHSVVYLDTLYRQEEYEVVGVLVLSADVRSESYVPYTGMRKFHSEDQFCSFAQRIQQKALHWKEGAEMFADDALLSLSTCYDEHRIVVICRRVSP